LHAKNGNVTIETPTNKQAMKKGTSIIKYVKNKQMRAIGRRAFHLWQIRPHEVAPLADTQCKCACCGTEYVGNFCPRCGQSASVSRFSLKQAIDLFLDVWDVNNRSVFRTMRDMLLRPGYMIRDYLNGMQAGYFSPFKMFFLLATLSLLVENGFFYSPENKNESTLDDFLTGIEVATTNENDESEVTTVSATEEDTAVSEAEQDSVSDTGKRIREKLENKRNNPTIKNLLKVGDIILKFSDENPALLTLMMLVLFSLSLFLFFRHCPLFPNLRFSEFVAVQVCSYNTYTLFMIIGTLLDSFFIKIFALFMLLVSLSQFSGYTKLRTFGYLTITILFWFTLAVIIVSLGIYFLAIR
jgi:hypothetical protein